ncbi:MAG: hypothetical protein NC122_01160 [Faecalibacterium sp.]|nr:hypothetical protein [Ruminococcus sp.]MCM1391229.1 hypothetical protein [Ruminococcus sp.]MCM1484797.1 hypothetical protein [Faecalibacterium sp.]
MDDNYLFNGILSVFNKVISDPELLRYESDKKNLYNPSLEVIRQENEIRYLMNQPKPQFQPIKKLVISCANDKISCCKEDFSFATDELIKYFSAMDKIDDFNYELLSDTIEKIVVNKDDSITIRFVNGKEINSEKGEQDNAGSKNSNKN